MYDKILYWYRCHLWTADMVRNAAAKGVLTAAQAEDILREVDTHDTDLSG